MAFFAKKRIEIVIEAPALPRVVRALEASGVSGWTILPAAGGSGADGAWSREGQVSEAGRMVALVTILDESRLAPLTDRLAEILERQVGIVAISDCQVLRGSRF